jgi:cytochrome c55X
MTRPGALALSLLLAAAPAFGAAPSPARQAELRNLLLQDCGACHGLTLKGGLGPALLPDTLRDKPVTFLAATILAGRPGTPMPPWSPFMTPAEADWLVRLLKEGVK